MSRRERTRPTRAVIASRVFAPEVAAASPRLRALAEGFVAAGCRTTVLTTKPPTGTSSAGLDPEGLRVSRWPVLRDGDGAVRGYVQYLSFDVPLLLRLLVTRRPGVVVSEPPPTTGLVTAAVCGLRRVPYAYFAADIWSDAAHADGAPSWVVRLLRAAEQRVLRGARLVLAVSDGVAARVRELGAPADRVHTTGNGVDTRVYTADGPARPDDWDPSVPYVVYAGTMSSWQGADVFLRGFALATDRLPPDARLVFVGQGTERRGLQQMAERLLPGRVDFPGLVAPEEAARWLRGAHAALVSIVPDRGYDFARPTKIWAAAACGTPVVFAGRGAGAELVRELDAGTAVDHDDAAVASAIVAAFTEPPEAGRRAAMADRARRQGGLDVLGQRAARAVLHACQ